MNHISDKRLKKISLFVAVLVLLLAPSGWSLEPLMEERIKVSVAVGPDDVFHGSIQLASAMGLFGQQGLNFQLMVMSSGAQAAWAVIHGRSLFGIHGFEQVLLARQNALPLMAIGKAAIGLGLQVAARERSLAEAWASPQLKGEKKFTLLKGRLIGIDASDLLQKVWIQWMAGKAGLNIQTDLHMMDVGNWYDAMAALGTGRVDLLVTRSPIGEMLQSKGTGRIVWPRTIEISESQPLYLIISMREDSLQAHEETAWKFLRAMRANFLFMTQQRDQTMSIASRLWPRIPEEALNQAVSNTLNLLPKDMTLQKDEARITTEMLLESGLLSRKIPFEQACTNQFLP
jgi:ABC-type nitrate/sulfonate/bicarbonate transport system substrate-binding protein